MFTITLKTDNDTKSFLFNTPISIGELFKEKYDKYAVAALISGRLYDLMKIIDYDCTIVPVDLSSEEGVRIYYRTLRFIFIMAVKKIFPNAKIKFMYGISRGQYCEVENITLSPEIIRAIENEMHIIIKQNVPFSKETVSKDTAIKLYSENENYDKLELIKYRPEDTVHIYKCKGEINYLYGYLLPSTGYIKGFKLHFNAPGVVILYPRHELGGIIPDFEQSVKFDKALWRAEEWGKLCGVSNISQLNDIIDGGQIKELINMCEIRHENEIEKMACNIASDIKNIKIILIAGPSSSGKTSLSRKLQAHLAVKGIRSLPVSCDDYFHNRDHFDEKTNGEIDYEHIERIDLELFNNDLVKLISGQSVELPVFNFKTGSRESGKTVRLEKDDCIIIEGIHGLNERLTHLIPRYNKYKIYISALSHINIDNNTPISTTTCRLIRRIVRDNLFRGRSIEETLALWQSVRNGEFKWIYPYQEDADYIFNSEVTYELAVLKKYIIPLINKIDRSSPYFIDVNKIDKIMKYIHSIDDNIVPCTSILREFIGGSSYVD